ncbi:TniQ family protein [Nocardia sp. X0981]
MALPNPASGPPPDPQDPARWLLTPVCPGRDIDAWPLAVPRYHDEQFERWLGRVSHRYGVSLSQIVKTMALPSMSEDSKTGAVMAVMLDFAQFARTLGLPHNQTDGPAEPDQAAIAVGNAVDPLRAVQPITLDRWCPACLAASGYWREQWLEWWALACPEHRVELVSQCPSCAKKPWSSRSWVYRAGPVDRCPEKMPGSHRSDFCGADLTLAPAKTVDPALLHAQLLFADLLDCAFEAPQEHVTLGEFTVPRTMGLHALCCLAAALADRNGNRPDDSHRLVRALADTFALFEDLVADRTNHALDLLLAPSGPLDPLSTGRGTITPTPNPLLTAAALRRREHLMKPADHLLFRCGRTHPALPPAQLDTARQQQVAPSDLLPDHRTVPLTVPATWVPQQLWPEAIDGIGDKPTTRSAVAICLLRLGRDIPTGAMALELGHPWQSARRIDAEIARIFGHRHWMQRLHDIEDLASKLHHAPPPIDYRARRILGTQPELLDTALDTANHRNHRESEQLTPEVRARFWERFTGSDIAWAPPVLAQYFRGTAYTRYTRTRLACDIHWDHTFRSGLDTLRTISTLPVIGPLDWTPPWLAGTGRVTAGAWQRFPYQQLFDDQATDPRPLLAYTVLTALVPDWEATENISHSPVPTSDRYRFFDAVPQLLHGNRGSLRSTPYPGEEHLGAMVARTCGTPDAPLLQFLLPHLHRWPHRQD